MTRISLALLFGLLAIAAAIYLAIYPGLGRNLGPGRYQFLKPDSGGLFLGDTVTGHVWILHQGKWEERAGTP